LNDYWFLLKKLILKNLKGSLNNLLSQNKLSVNLIDSFNIKEIESKFIDKINGKQKEKFKELISQYSFVNQSEDIVTKPFLKKIHSIKSFTKIGENILKDLTSNNRREFYLIEDWEATGKYFVVLLREIQKISWTLGAKIANGLNYDQINEEEIDKSDIRKTKEEFIYPLTAVKSPFIEHIIQRFFQNFGRIGVTDHKMSLPQNLINENILE